MPSRSKYPSVKTRFRAQPLLRPQRSQFLVDRLVPRDPLARTSLTSGARLRRLKTPSALVTQPVTPCHSQWLQRPPWATRGSSPALLRRRSPWLFARSVGTLPEPWSRELCGSLPARPARQRLVSGSCSSGRSFAPRFLPTVGHPPAVALRFACCDQLAVGLAPTRVRPCRAHKEKTPFKGVFK